MYGINEDAYWDQYQVTHDPQWRDNEEEVDEYDGISGAWEYADIGFEEDRLSEG